jgi:hypothetical protein
MNTVIRRIDHTVEKLQEIVKNNEPAAGRPKWTK